jgi:hypothetical protein
MEHNGKEKKPYNGTAIICVILAGLPVGIFFLFLICAYYPKRFEKPIQYSLFLILLSNTSLMGLIGAFILGIIFLFENIKKSHML